MKQQEELNDDVLLAALQASRRQLANPAFEGQVMHKIAIEQAYKAQVRLRLRNSLRCFAWAIVLITTLALFLLLSEVLSTFNYGKTLAALAFLVVGVGGILSLSNYKRLLRDYAV